VAQTFEICSQLLKIVQFPVINKKDVAVFTYHWLMARLGQVDNTKTVVGKSDTVTIVNKISPIIGPSVGKGIGYSNQL